MEEKKTTKLERCRFAHPNFHNPDGQEMSHKCGNKAFGGDSWTETCESMCERCEHFKSKYMEFPLTINDIVAEPIKTDSWHCKTGALVKVRPCGEEYGGRTYLGFYLGDLPLQIVHTFNEESGILTARTHRNPGIFVPELGEIIYGCGSWWSEIEREEDFKDITDQDINDTWYVKLARHLSGLEGKEGGSHD